MRTSFLHITATLLGLALATPSFAADYFVGAGAGCTHSTIQAAINSAAGQMGFDRIRIASNRIYTAQALVITAQPLTLEGGYANCNSSLPTPGVRTQISGQGGSSDSVITMSQSNGLDVNFINLSFVVGDETTTRIGGGLDVRGAGVVNLINVEIVPNSAGNGGGIHANGNAAGQLRLNLGPNTAISDNEAIVSGGGIHVEGTATLTTIGSPAGVLGNAAPNG